MHYPKFSCQVSKQLLKTWCLSRMIMCKHAHSFTRCVSFMATKQKSHIISVSFYVWIWKFETQIHICVCVCVSQHQCLVFMFKLFFSSHWMMMKDHEHNRMHKHLFLRLLLANYLKTGQNQTLLIICNPVITIKYTRSTDEKRVRKNFVRSIFFWLKLSFPFFSTEH